MIWLFAIAITIHNIEEAIWLPRWSNKHMKPMNPKVFYFSVSIVTLLAFLATLFYEIFDYDIFGFIYYGFLGSMMINAIAPHFILSIKKKVYMPGTITGLLVVIPVNGLILLNGVAGTTSAFFVATATLVIGVFLLALLPILFRIGRFIYKV